MSNFAVACKLPNGVTIDHAGQSVTFAGANSPNARFGYGVTYEVDPDWFEAWMADVGRDFPPVKAGVLFPINGDDDGELREKENDPALLTGQEPLDPEAPAPGIVPTDEMKKELAKTRAASDKAKAGSAPKK